MVTRLVALLPVLALLAGACAPGAEPEQRIHVVLFGDAEEIAGYRALVEAYHDTGPGVRVVLSPVATQDDLMARLTTSFAGGQPPGVFLLNFRRYGQFAAQGVIEEVQPHLDASAVLDESDYAEPALAAFRFDGQNLSCMPQNLSSLVVYYNADLFAQAGVEPPDESWTWDGFLAAARTLTDPDSGTYGLGFTPMLIRLAPFVWSNGGEIVDDEEAPTTLTIDRPGPERKALEWFLDLSLVHGVVPPDREEQSEEAEARFLRGRLGMYLSSRVAVPTLRRIEEFTWDVAPLPVAPGGVPATVLHSDAYCMSRGASAEAAWAFIEFAASVRGQEILARSGRTVPSHRAVAQSPAFLEPGEPPASSRVFLDAEPYLRATPRTATWARVEKEANALLAEVFYGRVEREEGIRRLVEQTRPLFGD